MSRLLNRILPELRQGTLGCHILFTPNSRALAPPPPPAYLHLELTEPEPGHAGRKKHTEVSQGKRDQEESNENEPTRLRGEISRNCLRKQKQEMPNKGLQSISFEGFRLLKINTNK